MLGLFERGLIREVLQLTAVVLLILLLIMVGAQFAALFALASAGQVPLGAIAPLASLDAVQQLVLLLPVAYYVAILTSVGRMYRNHEAYAWAVAGVGPARIYRPLFLIAIVLSGLTGYLSLELAPSAAAESKQLRAEAERNARFGLGVAGRFQSFESGRIVLYAGQVRPGSGELEDVFIHMDEQDQPITIRAKRGKLEPQDEISQVLRLFDGTRYEGVVGSGGYRVIHFREQGFRYELPAAEPSRLHRKAISTEELMSEPRSRADWAEWHWRLAAPSAVWVLALLAVPLARVSPRQRSAGLILGILIYVFYSNLMGLGRSWMAQKLILPIFGLWWVHLLFVLLALVLLARQDGWRWVFAAGWRRGQRRQ
ncbi:MAG: LPS export ABC transporter permease LptF [Pseudomonadota bacterium]|nr:LPS export ABC transporter permease LptF [Pseudomonadota bacterium]